MILGLPGEKEVRQVPLPLEDTPDRPGHSHQLQPLDLLSYPCNNITKILISSRNDQIYSVIPPLNKPKPRDILQFAKEP
jgi:hypothetical protein